MRRCLFYRRTGRRSVARPGPTRWSVRLTYDLQVIHSFRRVRSDRDEVGALRDVLFAALIVNAPTKMNWFHQPLIEEPRYTAVRTVNNAIDVHRLRHRWAYTARLNATECEL